MDTRYITELNKALRRLESIKEAQEQRLQELRRYDGFLLTSANINDTCYYYSRDTNKKRIYLGKETNSEVVAIKENRFIHQYLKDLRSEIKLIKRIITEHKELDHESVSSRLPKIYRKEFYMQTRESSHPAEAWLSEMKRIKAQYQVKYPENLKFRAADGTLMRSKSEVIIANLLIANRIPYIYELPLVINGIDIRPDFTALSTEDYKTVIRIEHEGMMDKDFYQKTFLSKVNTFLSADMVPGRDVYFTFDDLRGVIDTSPIQDIIDTRLKPRTSSAIK